MKLDNKTFTINEGEKNRYSKNKFRELFKKKTAKSNGRVPQAEFINPFINSVSNLFETILECPVMREELSLRMNLHPNLDIVAFISLSGAIQGTVALSFPTKTALAMVSRVYQEDMIIVDSTVMDAVGEFVNMVAAGAQSILANEMKQKIELSVPTMVRGTCFSIDYPSQATWLEVPFSSELGVFLLRVTIKKGDAE